MGDMIGIQEVSATAAFFAGVLSFFSPCVLPLVPSYLVYISGLSLEQVGGKASNRLRSLLAALLFVLGFSIVFIALGATATALGGWLFKHTVWFTRIGGVVVLILGLYIAELIPLPFLGKQRHFQYKGKLGLVGAPLLGIVFAFGWSPCVGPVLAAILGLAAMADTVGKGIALLALYSAGLAIPFIVAAIAVEFFLKAFESVKHYLQLVNILAGKLLVAMGLLLISNRFDIVSKFSYLSWSILAAGLGLLLVILIQIAVLGRVRNVLAEKGIERIPRTVVAMFFVDIIVLGGILFAAGQLASAG